jgi:hypothetical protein
MESSLRNEQPNNTINPTADGRHTLEARVGHSPAAGYTER